MVFQNHTNPRIALGYLALILFLLSACSREKNVDYKNQEFPSFFDELEGDRTGIDFANILDEDNLVNPFNYINAYNGGGAAIGDINNDGLADIYLTGNMVSSRLYINEGSMKFRDVTQEANVGTEGWCTGVTMADVNQDGLLDIYVCRAYHNDLKRRRNLLFINQGDGTFREEAGKYGIADGNFSVSASFFDYDKDGDLDLIVANHPRFRLVSGDEHIKNWKNPPKNYSSRLFKNNGGRFVDVTEQSGVLSYGFSLGVSTTDFNADGWQDIFISVDHSEPDILLQNNKDGTFSNVTNKAFSSVTRSSMGLDAGDVNHDVFPDLFVAEMLSEDPYREKVSMDMQTVNQFEWLVDSIGYAYYQMRNFLHLNQGNGTFSDVGQFSNTHKSDWSWSVLFMDADNDGWQDLFISNGYFRDIYHKDYFKPFDKKMMAISDMNVKNRLATEYVQKCPQPKVENYLFRNKGDLTFENVALFSGLERKTISTGAAYGDLDNDGDLDLVVNHLGEPATIYQNITSGENRYLRIKPESSAGPIYHGTKVIIKYGDGELQHRELLTTRGFQASCEPVVHFGLGAIERIDTVQVVWPNLSVQEFYDVPTNQELELSPEIGDEKYSPSPLTGFFAEKDPSEMGLGHTYYDPFYNDYADQVLLPHKLSEQGPFMSSADVNQSGRTDFYIGGAAGHAGQLFIQESSGQFRKRTFSSFEEDKQFEDAHSLFADVNGDGHPDLIVASGSYEFSAGDERFRPRIYLNDGSGRFDRRSFPFDGFKSSASCVAATDLTGNGTVDVFIGGRITPKRYPLAGKSGLFINDGKGNFTNVTETRAPGLSDIGMVTDAQWVDVNHDGLKDLMIVGEWMPITLFIQDENGQFHNKTDEFLPQSPKGWWNCIAKADLTGNGLQDFIVGNLGYNYKYKASKDFPFVVYASDFDESESMDIVLGTYYGNDLIPVRGRSCSSEQIPDIAEKFPTFSEYAESNLFDIYGDEDLESALKMTVDEFGSVILFQDEPGVFSIQTLPTLCQLSPVNDVVIRDVNEDGLPDLIVAGNLYQSEIETGRADAGVGRVVLNLGNREFNALEVYESGLFAPGDVKSLLSIDKGPASDVLLIGNNQDELQVFRSLGEPRAVFGSVE